MTERKYECYSEFWKYGIPQEMDGEVMTLREWLIKTGTYSEGFETKVTHLLLTICVTLWGSIYERYDDEN